MRHIRTVGTLLTAILCLAMITSNSVAPISPNTESMQAPPAQPKEDDPYEPYERFIKIFYDDSKAEVIVTSDGEIYIYFTDTSGVRYALPYTNPWDKFNSYEDIGLVKDTYPEASYIAFCANYVAGSEGLAAREFPHATILS